ncbi:MAG: hypothetical protein ACI9TY_000834 [Alphaproteobacteria bacterium]
MFLLCALVMFAPSITYYVAYYIVAPNYLVKEAKILGKEVDILNAELLTLRADNENYKINNDLLKAEGITARDQLAEITTRIEISEKSKTTTGDRVQLLEQEKLGLERKLAFFETFVTPDVDEEVLQCFNISLTQQGKKIKYGINFLKKDQKDKERLKTIVKMKVLYGANILDMNEDTSYKADREVKMDITKDRRLTGSLTADVPKEGLHILDIKAFNDNNKVIAHCWKAF